MVQTSIYAFLLLLIINKYVEVRDMSETVSKTAKILLGNEAIAYGAVDAGLGFASAYPGTPSTEIVETLFKLSREYGFYVEWSANEKVALEAAYGAAIGGVKSLVAMKHVGVNVAMDPLTTSAYTGVENSFVIVSADDPSMWSSQNEQDNRWFGVRSFIPILEAGSILEMKDITVNAFKLSERFRHPVILRSTTRLSHSRATFEISKAVKSRIRGKIIKKPEKYSVIPSHARELRKEVLKRWSSIEEYLSTANFNWFEGVGRSLIITSGLAYAYVKDMISILNIRDYRILKLSGMIPFPRKLVEKGLEDADRVLVVEELEPVIETFLKSFAYENGFRLEVHGKDLVPQIGELTLNKVGYAISRFYGLQYPFEKLSIDINPLNLPPRPPILCPGCPHRGVFYALRRALAKAGLRAIYNGDIGCYSLGIMPPFNMQDTIVEMGGSIGLANGFSHILSEKEIPVAIIGDSTFFHSGVPSLINAVYNRAPMLVLVLDNRVTAMTGAQPHPGTGFYASGEPAPEIDIEKVSLGVGVEFVTKFDPYNIPEAERSILKALEYVKNNGKPAVAIGARACALLIDSIARRRGIEKPLYKIDLEKCTGCGICYNAFSCPAIIPLKDGKAYIDPTLCIGCGECRFVCPYDAIILERPWTNEFNELWW